MQMNRFLYILLALLAASCTAERIPDVKGGHTRDRKIQFSPALNSTRADDPDGTITEIDDLWNKYHRGIGVFAVYTGKDNYNPAQKYPLDKYVYYNDEITKNTEGRWTCEGDDHYWPADDEKLSFFAIAPRPDDKDIDDKERTIRIESYPEEPFLHFDPLYSLDQVNKKYTDNKGKVDFKMHHAMARLTMRVRVNFDEKKFLEELIPKEWQKGSNYYLRYLPDTRSWIYLWKITDLKVLFLIDEVIVENVPTEGRIKIGAENADNLWVKDYNSPRKTVKVNRDDIRKEVRFENYPAPEGKWSDGKLNKYLVWQNVEDEAEHNANISPSPWSSKSSINETPSEAKAKAHRVFAKDIYFLPGDYSSDKKISFTIKYHASLVGTYQKEFKNKVSGSVDLLPSWQKDEDTGYFYYHDASKLIEYPSYRRFYAQAHSFDRKIGPISMKLDKVMPGKHYDVSLAVGVSTTSFDIKVADWDTEEVEYVFDEKLKEKVKVEKTITWEGVSSSEYVDVASDKLTYVNVKSGSTIKASDFMLSKIEGAMLMVEIIPISGSPEAFSFLTNDGQETAYIPKMSLDGSPMSFKIKSRGRPGDKAILRFYVKYPDFTSEVVKGMCGNDGEIILRIKE